MDEKQEPVSEIRLDGPMVGSSFSWRSPHLLKPNFCILSLVLFGMLQHLSVSTSTEYLLMNTSIRQRVRFQYGEWTAITAILGFLHG
jgi:hypothetical protein